MPIRPINVRDRDRYLELATEFYASQAVLHTVPLSYLEKTFDEMIRSRDVVEGMVLEDDQGRIAGYAVVSKMFSQEAGGLVAWMEELYLRPAFQGMGLGTDFLAQYEQMHPEIARFRLEVERNNHRAIALYQRLGYVEVPYYQMIKDRPLESADSEVKP